MNYKEIRTMIEEMAKESHEDFVKSLISFEKGIHDKEALDTLYERYMENDSMSLLHDEFDYMIDELRESGQIRDDVSFEKEENELVNIVGNIVGKLEVLERVSKTGEAFEVVNFSVVSKDTEGNKHYTNCSAYGEKANIPKGFKPGDFVKIFGQERKSIDENGREHRNVKILSSKILKEKEQTKEKVDKNKSVLETIKKFKIEEKAKLQEKMGLIKGVER
jgi:hypothetical protein fgonA2_02294